VLSALFRSAKLESSISRVGDIPKVPFRRIAVYGSRIIEKCFIEIIESEITEGSRK
jgi:hypothetical protein